MASLFSNPSYLLYRRLLREYVAPYKRTLFIGGFFMLLMAVTSVAPAYYLKPIVDKVFTHHDLNALYIYTPLLVLAAFFSAIGDYGQSLSLKYVGQKVVSNMQVDLFAHLMRADITMFHDQSSGRLISRMTNDIMLMRRSVSEIVTGLIKESCTALFLLAMMFWESFELSLIAFGIIVFAVLPISRLGRRMRKVTDTTQSQLADFTSQLDDTFQGVRMVKAYAREDFEVNRTRDTIRKMFKVYYKTARIESAPSPIMGFVSGIASALVVWYAGYKAIHGDFTAGDFSRFFAAMLMAYRPIKIIAGLNTQLQAGMAAADRFYTVLDTKPTITDRDDAKPLTVTAGSIAFNNASFTYATGSGGVSGLSFTAPAGKTVALVGASGAGKTTIMNLLLRFYEVQAGTITIDGTDVRDVTINSLRSNLALVSQDIVLFNDSVRANIAYGMLDATDEQITEAAKKAHAHEFISELPEAYDTQIGPAGVKLSGGQRQRISIARAILKDAPILLLDEATSALDTASERAVQEALTGLMTNRTTLVIAHRLTTIQDADIILVLEGGRIAAQGTHADLLAMSEIYRNMHALYHQQGDV